MDYLYKDKNFQPIIMSKHTGKQVASRRNDKDPVA